MRGRLVRLVRVVRWNGGSWEGGGFEAVLLQVLLLPLHFLRRFALVRFSPVDIPGKLPWWRWRDREPR